MNILIVESHLEEARALCAMLQPYGLEVTTAATVEEGLIALAKTRVDAILLNVFTENIRCGVESFYRIQSNALGIPIVVFTTDADHELALKFVRDGAQDCLLKDVASDDSIVRCLQYAVERNRNQVALRNGEERLRVILENSYDAFISMDAKRLITDWNAQAEKTFGWNKKEALGQNLSFIIPQHLRRRYLRDIEAFFANHEGNLLKIGRELIATHKDGKEFPIELMMFRVKEDAHFVFCTFVRDISEQKRSSQALEALIEERTQKLLIRNEELHQFAKIAAHDLQEPLRTIQGFAQLLGDNCSEKLDDDGREFIDYIMDGVKRMQVLIKSVLAHSQIPTDAIQDADSDCNLILDEVMQNLSASFAESCANIEVGTLPNVAVERTQVIQLFQNLLSNSIKYRGVEPLQISIRAESSANKWLFSIEDNGIGIDPKYSDEVFNMFSRLNGKVKYPGAGVGLAICKKIVTTHGGNIWVDSKLGQGAIFLFTLPATNKARNRKMKKLNSIEILLVEDTPSDVRLTQEALKHSNFQYSLIVKSDGVEALEYLKEIKNSGSKLPDIMLLDLNMPRMNGHEVLTELSKDTTLKEIPVVLLTVSERQEDILDALRSKMNYYIAKPVTGEKLSTLINAIHELQKSESAENKPRSNEELHIRLVLAGNPHTSEVALKKLSDDPSERVRSRVAENANLPLEIFLKLVTDSSIDVRTSIGENPNAPDEILELLSKDSSDDVRLALSTNSAIPLHLLTVLSEDDNMFVASSAKRTLESIGSKTTAK
ncbi:MAG: hypothetical protein DKT66_06975 [Candidatus Melainabacteria bacterium]|nr:MAG: hypothetical protein DKT66_06975 [Candidatus Melainabacteria bacterium]